MSIKSIDFIVIIEYNVPEVDMIDISPSLGIIIGLIACIAEYIDSSLGMGYGTALTPILLLFGFDPAVIVPSVLLSECITGLSAAVIHAKVKNVSFFPKGLHLSTLALECKRSGTVKTLAHMLSRAAKTACIISCSSAAATVCAVIFAVSISSFYVKLYIGVMILAVGIVLLCSFRQKPAFSWTKIAVLGAVASFNKGVSGGGYGPVVTGGQILAGIDGKSAIAVTALAEGITCLVGVSAYVISRGFAQLELVPYLVVGALFSVPLSALTVKHLHIKKLTGMIGIITTLLGLLTLLKLFFL